MRKTFLSMLLAICTFSILMIHPLTSIAAKKKNKTRILLIDGQSINHQHWREWTPVLLKQLDETGLFELNIATSPVKGESLDKFNPKFKDYDVVVTIYDGDTWSARARRNLERFVAKGGGLVVVHAADNAFPGWEAYNLMCGVGGWGNRTETSGPYIFIDDTGEIKRDLSPGPAGHHGPKHEFVVESRKPDHPIMKGLPQNWLHVEDELYDQLRGPAVNMEILATAYSAEKFEGTRRHEPVLMTINFEDGRVFHTTMGHSKEALSCVGFMTTFVRGCQWVAGEDVTFEMPEDFPVENTTSSRTY